MIVWINGAFGAGKTQAAFELARRLGDRAVVCDPEVVGYGLQRMLPRRLRPDFQDLSAWRLGVREGLALVDADPLTDVVVVPMTLVEPQYVEELLGWLRGRAHEVRHVVLDADADVLRQRLRGRIAAIRAADTWALGQVDRCTTALPDIDAAHRPLHVRSDTLGHDEVVEAIATTLELHLMHPRRPRAVRPLQTAWNSLRVIRL